MRSRAAAAVLKGAGFREVYSMAGGIDAWHGGVALGSPDRSVAYFLEAASLDHMLALAWSMEEGALRFYSAAAEKSTTPEAETLFQQLVTAEIHHKASVEKLRERLAPGESSFDELVGEPNLVGNIMEGGFSTEEIIKRYAALDPEDVLAFAMAMETTSFDLYLRLGRTVKEDEATRAFQSLAHEERKHLDRLAQAMDQGF